MNELTALKQLNPEYENEGFVLLKFKNHEDKIIDITYRLDYDKFSQKYQDGFSKILRLDEIKKELETKFKTKVDLKPLCISTRTIPNSKVNML